MFERLFGSLFSGDGLSSAAQAALEKAAAPLFAGVRDELLRRVTADPPPSFGTRLRALLNSPDLNDAEIHKFWQILIASAADAPGDEYLQSVNAA